MSQSEGRSLKLGKIYQIINIENGKRYIGQTTQSLRKRFDNHLSAALRDIDTYLYNAMRKSISNYIESTNRNIDDMDLRSIIKKKFKVQLIEDNIHKSKLNKREHFHIKNYKTYIYDYGTKFGYNMTEGGEDYQRIDISQERLKNLIKKGLTKSEIAEILDVCEKTIDSRCQSYWGCYIDGIREKLGILEKTKELIMNARSERFSGEGNPYYRDVNISRLKDLLIKGLSLEDILHRMRLGRGKFYKVIYKNWGFNSITELRNAWNINFESARQSEDLIEISKSELKKKIKEGLSMGELENVFDCSEGTIYNRIEKYWGFTSLSDLRKYLGVVPKKDLEGLLYQSKLEEYFSLGYNGRKISELIDIPYSKIKRWVKELWKVGIKEVKDFFYYRPNLIKAIKKGYSLSEIEMETGMNKDTINSKCYKFWDAPLSEAREKLGAHQSFRTRLNKKISESLKEKEISKEWRQKLSDHWTEEKNPNWVEISKSELKRYIKKGLSQKEIGKQFNCTRRCIRDKINLYWGKGIEQLKKEWNVGKRTIPKNEELKKAILKGLTGKELAKEFGYSRCAINKYIKKYWPDAPSLTKAREKFSKEVN